MSVPCDLAVIGGGGCGFAAALAGARLGLRTVLVEKADMLGGNGVRGGVNCWEMGAGGTGIPFELYRRLKRVPQAIGIYSYGRHGSWYKPEREPYRFLGGEMVLDPARRYLDTLQRHGSTGMGGNEAWCREHWHGVPFEPGLMAAQMLAMLRETGRCDTRLNTHFTAVHHEGGVVREITLSDGDTLRPWAVVDGTADALLCLAAGCPMMAGQEARATFNEPSAPLEANSHINGVTLCFRVTPVATPAIEPLPDGIPAEPWWGRAQTWVSMNHYPNGDRNINMLPTMEGGEFVTLGYPAAYAECRRRVYCQWQWMQRTMSEFQHWRLSWIAPALGVRESRRVIGEYVLTEHDLRAGYRGQRHDDLITVADHAMDTHGRSTGRAGCGEVSEPYGIPYRCLIPKGFQNLLVACRAASFSSLAASSARLTRTMMQLGQAAGTGCAVARELGRSPAAAPGPAIRAALARQFAQVAHPMPLELRHHLTHEDR